MLAILLLLLACAPAAETPPPDVETVCRDMLREFDDDGVVESAEYLADWLDGVVDADEDGYELGPLEVADVEGLEHSDDLDVTAMMGAVVVRRSRGSLDAYAAVVPEPDQSFADKTYDAWDRTLIEGTADGYLAGGDLGTSDAVVKSTLGVTIPYPLRKDYRWIETSRGTAQVMRTWIVDEGWSQDEKNGVIGGFTIEAWYPDGDDGILWVNASWSTLVTALDDFVTDEDFWVEQLIGGTRDYMEGTEAHVNGEDE